MFTRCAFFEGRVAATDRARFRSIVSEQIVPRMLDFPRIRRLELMWGCDCEAPDRDIYLVIGHGYDSLDDIQAAIASSARRSMQPSLDELVSLFDGRIYHVNFESDGRWNA